MAGYFENFPTTEHDILRNNNPRIVTNVLRRFRFDPSVKNRLDVFYPYRIQDGDRPDTIADKYYGNSKYAWVVLLFNDIADPLFDWPMDDATLTNYIRDKYGSVSAAHQTTHERRLILSAGKKLSSGRILKKRFVIVDESTYNATPEGDRELVTKWEYEVDRNDARRDIKILDKKYISLVRNEIRDILKD